MWIACWCWCWCWLESSCCWLLLLLLVTVLLMKLVVLVLMLMLMLVLVLMLIVDTAQIGPTRHAAKTASLRQLMGGSQSLWPINESCSERHNTGTPGSAHGRT